MDIVPNILYRDVYAHSKAPFTTHGLGLLITSREVPIASSVQQEEESPGRLQPPTPKKKHTLQEEQNQSSSL